MPKYEWYFENKDDDVSICKHVTYKIAFDLYLRSFKSFNLFTVLNIFFKINVD